MASGPQAVSRPRGARGMLVGGGVLLVLLLVAAVLLATGRGDDGSAAAAPTPTPTPTKTVTVPDIYQRVGPSVAVIRTAKGALGTGVIVGSDGTVLTANHVIADRSAVSLIFADGTRSAATVASADPAHDIATLTPATLPQPIVPATLGGDAEVGGEVVAIGNPLGLTYSVSSGVVSAIGRTADTNTGKFTGLIQFDASVNPGSSGGPLLDAQGDVIGIVLSIADPSHDDSFAGIAFAVPIGTALGGGPGGGGGPQT
ncbi:MAG TPA: trypsin-like peptidase domain-containing protein [Mycobacteriales bacterium]|jgi:putative serine protease PepD|nr:trypsin-like peptidase domain-containing protein [Mycobacteriales bacterium]